MNMYWYIYIYGCQGPHEIQLLETQLDELGNSQSVNKRGFATVLQNHIYIYAYIHIYIYAFIHIYIYT